MPPIKTQARAATILPNFVGLIFQVHNGKVYNDVRITEDMVGHKLGEFSAYVLPSRDNWMGRSDNQQHPETLHIQADEEQVEGRGGLHGNGANASLDDDTTGENSVKYLYVMALGIQESATIQKSLGGTSVLRSKVRLLFAQVHAVHLWSSKQPADGGAVLGAYVYSRTGWQDQHAGVRWP